MEELNTYAEKNSSVDHEIDTLIRQLGEGNEIVLDARLGYYWIHDSFKVYLLADPDIAAKRIFGDVEDGNRDQDGAKTLNQTIISINKQTEDTRQRYMRRY